MIKLARSVGLLWRNSTAKPKAVIQEESFTIVDPYFYNEPGIVPKVQNWFTNRETLNDVERSFRDFKRKHADRRFLSTYNLVVEAV